MVSSVLLFVLMQDILRQIRLRARTPPAPSPGLFPGTPRRIDGASWGAKRPRQIKCSLQSTQTQAVIVVHILRRKSGHTFCQTMLHIPHSSLLFDALYSALHNFQSWKRQPLPTARMHTSQLCFSAYRYPNVVRGPAWLILVRSCVVSCW